MVGRINKSQNQQVFHWTSFFKWILNILFSWVNFLCSLQPEFQINSKQKISAKNFGLKFFCDVATTLKHSKSFCFARKIFLRSWELWILFKRDASSENLFSYCHLAAFERRSLWFFPSSTLSTIINWSFLSLLVLFFCWLSCE